MSGYCFTVASVCRKFINAMMLYLSPAASEKRLCASAWSWCLLVDRQLMWIVHLLFHGFQNSEMFTNVHQRNSVSYLILIFRQFKNMTLYTLHIWWIFTSVAYVRFHLIFLMWTVLTIHCRQIWSKRESAKFCVLIKYSFNQSSIF
jgi:hypothetical protein